MAVASYRISHTTTYSYESPVRVCHNMLMLSPRTDWCVRPISHRVHVKPHPQHMTRREDYFGNQIHAFSLEENHKQLVVSATGRVDVELDPLQPSDASEPWESVRSAIADQSDPRWLDACQFRFNSPKIMASETFRDYALESFVAGRPILQAAEELTGRIFEDFTYDPDATHVHTPAEEAFEMRRGVCQDLAHVQIACLRSLGLSARYVSGYLRTTPPPGQAKLIGADQSHAWVSVYCGPTFGWVDLDPTNNCTCNLDHIPIAWGRDYSDVVPIRGVFLGGGRHAIHVSVDVAEISNS